MFQFHSGSIKRMTTIMRTTRSMSFNSIVVRLKAAGADFQDRHRCRFNSIVVRLKGSMPGRPRTISSKFQFHSGSIKSCGAEQRGSGLVQVSIP